MKFKDWLLKESPDTVSGQNLNWRDGRTFCLFDSYTLISVKGVTIIHESIAHRINECYLAIQAVLRNEASPQELSDCLTSPSRRDGSNFLESKGSISKISLDQLSKTVQMSQTVQNNLKDLSNTDPTKKKEFASYRAMSLKNTPDVILGRLWESEKIISFWNPSNSVFSHSQSILKFIGELGDASKYKYEVENELLSYDEFMGGKKAKNVSFDPSIVHTMVPGEAKTQLQKLMGMVPGKRIDLRSRQLAHTSEATTAKDVLKGAAIGGAFMVPLAGLPLALYLAKKFYGKKATPEQVKKIEDQLKSSNPKN